MSETSYQVPESSKFFASGTKAVRVNLSTLTVASGPDLKGSFVAPSSVPLLQTIPSGYPGYDGTSSFYPGVSASYYYDVDGSTPITRPSWLKDVQVGVVNLPTDPSICSSFGTPSYPGYFQTSEFNCHGVSGGTGRGTDQTFIRIVLDRDQTYIGTKENLLIQLEYDATGLRLNPDPLDSADAPIAPLSNDPEEFVDQLWKIFSGSSLVSSATPNPFALVIPPNHAYHCPQGRGSNTTSCLDSVEPRTIVRQFIFPLASLGDAAYIQISRVKGGRKLSTVGGGGQDTTYFTNLCGSGVSDADNNPYCLGVLFRSLTLIRI